MDMKLDLTFALVICGLGLAACGSSQTLPGLDAFKPKPTTTTLLVQSNPDGADARSSLGGTCRTPCTMAIATAGDFTISFARDGYEPQKGRGVAHFPAVLAWRTVSPKMPAQSLASPSIFSRRNIAHRDRFEYRPDSP